MPAIITHHLFGRNAYPAAADVLGFSTQDERDAFLLGNQGPDPLFYLAANLLTRKANLVGGLLHDRRPALLLASLRGACMRLKGHERAIADAFVAGFCCHYLLDRAVHPLVYAQQEAICAAGVDGLGPGDGSRVHNEIERDLDEAVLFSKTGQTVQTWHPHEECLKGSVQVLHVASKLVFRACLWTYAHTIDVWAFDEAVRCFRLVQRLFHSPKGTSREALSLLERRVTGGRYSLVSAMAHRVRAERTSDFDNRAHAAWENPFTHETSAKSFWDLYEGALGEVPGFLRTVFSEGFHEPAAQGLTGNLNFSGRPVDPE